MTLEFKPIRTRQLHATGTFYAVWKIEWKIQEYENYRKFFLRRWTSQMSAKNGKTVHYVGK